MDSGKALQHTPRVFYCSIALGHRAEDERFLPREPKTYL